MAENRQYDHEYKVQAVKLAKEKEIEQAKAAEELGIQKIPCMAGYGPAALVISTLGQAHRLLKGHDS